MIIDDLVVDKNYRGKGYGSTLFDWIVDYAKKNNCQAIELSSSVKRYRAHKFYMKKGMNITHHHFSIKI
jgi:GNAT superfamily N-acetyltransferase